MDNMRERLVTMLQDAVGGGARHKAEIIADHLIANGVILPPCKVGDRLYIITNTSKEIVESVVIGVWMTDGVVSILTIQGAILNDSLGKNVFLTREEAEKALKERDNND